tara:strand:- start:442 stop:612 length:171 start_codon:yes stop_codon:yes gene_type:complete
MPQTFVEKCDCCENRILSISRSIGSDIDGDYLCIDLTLEQLALLSYQIQKQLRLAD